jgi:hypothetical protein
MKGVILKNGDFLISWVAISSPKGIPSMVRERNALYLTILAVVKIA